MTAVGFINFDDARKGRGAFAFFNNAVSGFDKEHGHTAARQSDEFGSFAGRQIMREGSDDLTQFTFANFGASVIAV